MRNRIVRFVYGQPRWRPEDVVPHTAAHVWRTVIDLGLVLLVGAVGIGTLVGVAFWVGGDSFWSPVGGFLYAWLLLCGLVLAPWAVVNWVRLGVKAAVAAFRQWLSSRSEPRAKASQNRLLPPAPGAQSESVQSAPLTPRVPVTRAGPWSYHELRSRNLVSPAQRETPRTLVTPRPEVSQPVRLSDAEIINRLRNLTPTAFEKRVASLFEAQGYTAEVTPPSGDGGYDIVLGREGERMLVECKRYGARTAVGRPDIQKLVGAAAMLSTKRVFFVTTGRFTREALSEARLSGLVTVKLVGPRGLVRMARDTGWA